MAIAKKSITTTWSAITTAGQSGVCWLSEYDADIVGTGTVYVYHGSVAPTGDLKLDVSKRVYTPNGNGDFLEISADDASDVYYARTADGTASLIVDVS